MVPEEGIQKAKEVIACRGIHYLIDPWQRVRIFGAGLVEVGEVHAEEPAAVALGRYDWVGGPRGVSDLMDEFCPLELLYFLDDEILLFWGWHFVLHGTSIGTHC
jgi:hypothetical protein